MFQNIKKMKNLNERKLRSENLRNGNEMFMWMQKYKMRYKTETQRIDISDIKIPALNENSINSLPILNILKFFPEHCI